MWQSMKTFVQDANMHWRDLFYIGVIGVLLMMATDTFTHWVCN